MLVYNGWELFISRKHHEGYLCRRASLSDDFLFVQVSKGKEEISFYSIPEFEEWKENTANVKSWKVKYYKGLGTSTPKEAKEYFADMDRHRILFDYSGIADDEAISLVSTLTFSLVYKFSLCMATKLFNNNTACRFGLSIRRVRKTFRPDFVDIFALYW